MFSFAISQHLPLPSSELILTMILLEDWSIVSIAGEDSEQYLQSQLTLDIFHLDKKQPHIAAHCNPKGKMWSNLLLFYNNHEYYYLIRSNIKNIQVEELKKYAVFSRVTITSRDEKVLIGIVGIQAREALSELFEKLPDMNNSVINQDDTILLRITQPKERFIIVTNNEMAKKLYKKLKEKRAHTSNSSQWLALEIEAGIPIIDAPSSGKFIPQATNMQALNAISFKKGCYIGQEIIAKSKYRGTNKFSLYWLVGYATNLPMCNDCLEIKKANNWRRTGNVLNSVKLANSNIWVQAVLNNNLFKNSVLRVENDEKSYLRINSLPYSNKIDQ
ncbi:tRNA-modifying protein YgfZ [Candidatus Ishikawella capsulata]|nr:tRNA-modifying protein YgfZ [Candidatus Ishikawaella capsulata]